MFGLMSIVFLVMGLSILTGTGLILATAKILPNMEIEKDD